MSAWVWCALAGVVQVMPALQMLGVNDNRLTGFAGLPTHPNLHVLQVRARAVSVLSLEVKQKRFRFLGWSRTSAAGALACAPQARAWSVGCREGPSPPTLPMTKPLIRARTPR